MLPKILGLVWVFSCLLGCSEREQAVPITADFNIEVVDNDFSVPVEVRISNATTGADTYRWDFSGATPSFSSDRNPGSVTYNEPGTYTIRLEASNRDSIRETKEMTIPIDAEILIGFTTEILVDSFPPMEVALANTTKGAETYRWTFQNGDPATSNQQHPDNVIFHSPGEHIIALEVSNGLETYQVQDTVSVAPHLVADFAYEVSVEDNDMQVPVTVNIINASSSATTYQWTFDGGNPATSAEATPTVTYAIPGTYELVLEASNGKETQTISQSITVFPNTNIKVVEDIKLGINTAHKDNEIGAFFSAKTGEVYTQEALTDENAGLIDVVFYGLNQNFSFNKFISPHQAEQYAFETIPNAQATKIINRLENCNCGAALSVAEFDAMEDDTLLRELTISETSAGSQDFDDSRIPRIVLFETEDGRKGAIKIKEYVMNGRSSYMLVDSKVQKQ